MGHVHLQCCQMQAQADLLCTLVAAQDSLKRYGGDCRSLVALPVLAVAFVAHPGLAGCCAAAAATLVGKSSQGSDPHVKNRDSADVQDNTQSGRGERKARIYG